MRSWVSKTYGKLLKILKEGIYMVVFQKDIRGAVEVITPLQ